MFGGIGGFLERVASRTFTSHMSRMQCFSLETGVFHVLRAFLVSSRCRLSLERGNSAILKRADGAWRV